MLDQAFSQKEQTPVIHMNVRIVVITEIALGQMADGVGCDSSAKTHRRLVKYFWTPKDLSGLPCISVEGVTLPRYSVDSC